MKKVLTIFAYAVLAFVLAAGGYFAGQRSRMSSISSALPRNTLERPADESSVSPPPSRSNEAAPAEEPMPPMETARTERNIIEKNSQTAVAPNHTEVSGAPITIDGSQAEVKLYTSAEKDENGEFLWDDGNQWVLEVQKDGEYYTLINKYVQLGKVSVMTAADDSGEGVITAVVSTGSGISVEKYTYNGTSFEGETVYNSGVLNVINSTF